MTNIPKQFIKKRWGIFINNEIAAYISCSETCKEITASLANRSYRGHSISIVEKEI